MQRRGTFTEKEEKQKKGGCVSPVLTHPLFQAIKGRDVVWWMARRPLTDCRELWCHAAESLQFLHSAPFTDDSSGLGRTGAGPHPLLLFCSVLFSSPLSWFYDTHLVTLQYFYGPRQTVPQQPSQRHRETQQSINQHSDQQSGVKTPVQCRT